VKRKLKEKSQNQKKRKVKDARKEQGLNSQEAIKEM
jgi:hypothetical protein